MGSNDTQWQTTQCLRRLRAGETRAADELLPLVYDELRAIAAARLRQERINHTLQPTALVHEAYLKLVDQRDAIVEDRAHFIAVAAEAIRRILIDHARSRQAAKRQAPGAGVSVHDELAAPADEPAVDYLALDEALRRLAQLNERQAKVVELRFFGGLGVEETARVLGVSENTVKGDWRVARAWLETQIGFETRA